MREQSLIEIQKLETRIMEVTIIGGGDIGLCCAYYLNKQGYGRKIFRILITCCS